MFFITPVLNAQDNFNADSTFEKTSNYNFLELKDTYSVSATEINTKLSEVGSTFFMEKYIIYSSRKTGAIGAGKDTNTNNPYTSLYCLSVDDTGNLSKPYFFATPLDLDGNEGGITFNANSKTVYFTNSREGNSTNYQLYKASFNPECKCKHVWKNEGKTDFNSDEYSMEHPTVASNGKKIYFSSNMPGGFGGYDIYSADLDENGDLKNLQNLGEKINTTADENYPFITPENKLYFSSNGHEGYGGQDLFVSHVNKRNVSSPINLGKTINTPADEIAFTIGPKNWGFFSSNRSKSLGYFDIYKFNLTEQKNIITGKTVEKNSKIVLPNTKVELLDEYGEIIETKNTDTNGDFKFEVTPLSSYTIVATKEGYKNFSNPIIGSIGEKKSDIELTQKEAEITEFSIKIENIYFDFNKASIKNESTLSLNKIFDVLINNPEMKISVNAHTDSKGTEKYNQLLSEKRALSAKQYLINKGIDPSRIISKGFGESQLLSKCSENCTELEFEMDRRIEFIILK